VEVRGLKMYLGHINNVSKEEEQDLAGVFSSHRDEPLDKYDEYLFLLGI